MLIPCWRLQKGKVSHWDVVNEAYTNQDLQTITGSEEILYDGFRTLKAKTTQCFSLYQ